MSDPTLKPPFILFADDDPDILQLLVIYAKARGWVADTASRAREVIEKVNQHCGEQGTCYDAILTDINFQSNVHLTDDGPRITGITAVKEIRREYPEVPVVFYTGFDSTLIREQARKAGGEASDYVVKSQRLAAGEDEINRVLDRIQHLLDWVRARQPAPKGSDRRANQVAAAKHTQRREEGGPGLSVPGVIERVLTQVRGAIKGSS